MAEQNWKTTIALDSGREIAAGSFFAALLALGFLATVVAVAPPRANPFGLMVGGGAMSLEQRAALARELGMSYFRPWDINASEWTGKHRDTEYFEKAGFRIVMTVRNAGKGTSPARPSAPPSDLQAYGGTIGSILDAYRPEVLCIENEENMAASYAGTPDQYGRQLRVACDAAHARGIKCTNGGLSGGSIAALVWNDYMTRGDRAKAEAFLERASTPAEHQRMRSPAGRKRLDDSIRKGQALLAAYKAAGVDYVNFHWYAADPRALEEAVDFLKARTRLTPITNEIGQRDQNGKTVTGLMAKILDLETPIAIWSSLDRPQARALQNPDGKWRESGLATKTFLWRRLP